MDAEDGPPHHEGPRWDATTAPTSEANVDIATSPFLAALLDHVPALEERASRERWLVLVPRPDALPPPHRMTLGLLHAHVLVPNGAAGHRTLSGRAVARPARDVLSVGPPDFAQERTVRVLFEEKFYLRGRADSDLAYVVCCVSRPLEGGSDAPRLADGSEAFAKDRSQAAWWELFASDQLGARFLARLSRAVDSVAGEAAAAAAPPPSSFAIATRRALPAPLRAAAASSLEELREHDAFRAAWSDAAYMDVLAAAAEACAHAVAYAGIFSALCEEHAAAEKDLQLRLHDLRAVVVADPMRLRRCAASEGDSLAGSGSAADADARVARLGLVPLLELAAPRAAAVQRAAESLSRLNIPRCPSEKLACAVEAGRALTGLRGGADDALPLSLSALLLAAPGLVLANLAYMEEYCDRVDAKSEAAFHLATLRALVAMVQQHALRDDGALDAGAVRRGFFAWGGSGGGLFAGPAATTALAAPQRPALPLLDWLGSLSCAPASRV